MTVYHVTEKLFDGNKQIVIFFLLPEMCVKMLKNNIATSASFCLVLYIHSELVSGSSFLFLSQLFFIFTSTQVKKWTGNVPFLHIIGLDRPQTTFNRYTILHPKKQDAEEDYTTFLHVLSVYIISFNQVLL